MRDILRSAAKVGIATVASLLGWMVAGKIISLQVGAVGVGLFGLLRQLLTNLTVISTFNGQTALVQGVACRPEGEQDRYAGTVLRIQALITGTLVLGLIFGAPVLASRLIPHSHAVPMLRWLAVGVLAMSAQAYFLSLLNGHRLVDALMKSQLPGPLAVLLMVLPTVWLVRGGRPAGFIIMLAVPAAVVALAAALACHRKGLLPRWKWEWPNVADSGYFFRISSVLFIAGLFTSSVQYFQNWMVAWHLGLEQSGQYWVAYSLSMSYVTLVLGSYGTYYLPSLSQVADPAERRALIRTYWRLALIAMPVIVSLVVVFKPWVVRLMFHATLLPSLKVMRWMLIGDLFKGLSWVLAIPMVAFGEMKWFFWSETLFALGTAGATWLWVGHGGGIEGLGFLFAAGYLLYLATMTMYIGLRHGFRWQIQEFWGFLGGIALVGGLSAVTWHDQTVRPLAMILGLTLIGGFLAFMIRKPNLRVLMDPRQP
jgi:PST family polysaccharide transporter